MPLTEDQHPVGGLGPDGSDEPFVGRHRRCDAVRRRGREVQASDRHPRALVACHRASVRGWLVGLRRLGRRAVWSIACPWTQSRAACCCQCGGAFSRPWAEPRRLEPTSTSATSSRSGGCWDRASTCNAPSRTKTGPRDTASALRRWVGLSVERGVGVGAQLGDQAACGAGADFQPLAQRFRGDRSLMLLLMQHVLGAGPVQQVLPACLARGFA